VGVRESDWGNRLEVDGRVDEVVRLFGYRLVVPCMKYVMGLSSEQTSLSSTHHVAVDSNPSFLSTGLERRSMANIRNPLMEVKHAYLMIYPPFPSLLPSYQW
jgi:hypothetical protein